MWILLSWMLDLLRCIAYVSRTLLIVMYASESLIAEWKRGKSKEWKEWEKGFWIWIGNPKSASDGRSIPVGPDEWSTESYRSGHDRATGLGGWPAVLYRSIDYRCYSLCLKQSTRLFVEVDRLIHSSSHMGDRLSSGSWPIKAACLC